MDHLSNLHFLLRINVLEKNQQSKIKPADIFFLCYYLIRQNLSNVLNCQVSRSQYYFKHIKHYILYSIQMDSHKEPEPETNSPVAPVDNKAHEYDYALVEQQEKLIRKEIEDESPLVSEIKVLQILMAEYCGNQPFLIKIKQMAKKYTGYRKTRRDGSCFYRAFLFRAFEVILLEKNEQYKTKLLEKIKGAKEFLKKAGFEGFVYEEAQELFIQKIQALKPSLKTDQLLATFNDDLVSNYLVLMLRFLTSGELKNKPEQYEVFIENQIPIDMFCQLEVEPIDKEADQIQIMALLNYIEIPIRIVYLDSNLTTVEPSSMVFPMEVKEDPSIVLLYRPGHYDILYR